MDAARCCSPSESVEKVFAPLPELGGPVPLALAPPRTLGLLTCGTRRWAQRRALRPEMAADAAADRFFEAIEAAHRSGIEELVFYPFSTAPSKPGRLELGLLIGVLRQGAARLGPLARRLALCFRVPEAASLPHPLGPVFRALCGRTAGNGGMRVQIALREGGPPPDLLIQTGASAAAAELVWEARGDRVRSPVLWPDFEPRHLDAVLAAHTRRRQGAAKLR